MIVERTLTEHHGGYRHEWVGYGASFAVVDGQEATVVDETWTQNTYRLHPERVTGKVVVDLGACFGAFTMAALRMGARRVLAVEPEPANYARLLDTLDRNGVRGDAVVRTSQGAVGYRGLRYRTVGTGVCAHTAPPEGTVYPGEAPVLVGLADVVAAAGGSQVDFLKCDVEGGEYGLVLDAEPGVLGLVGFIAMEWHGQGLAPSSVAQPYESTDTVGNLVQHLLWTHHVEVSGTPDVGGMLYATRR